MATPGIENFTGSSITGAHVQEASILFSTYYGVWALEAASKLGAFAQASPSVQAAQAMPSQSIRSQAVLSVSSLTA
jgi:hypothetical protein